MTATTAEPRQERPFFKALAETVRLRPAALASSNAVSARVTNVSTEPPDGEAATPTETETVPRI